MPRIARGKILYDGCFSHVYSRALDKRTIFSCREDFEYFKQLLRITKADYGYRLHHYCLMNTHFHLVVSIPDVEGFSLGLKEIKEKYARRCKIRRGRKGPVWWGRFGSQLIENEKYLYACGLYVEMNPVKEGIARQAAEWAYSSGRHYFGSVKDDLVDDYERPSYETAAVLLEGLNVGRGSYIGTPLFLLKLKTS